MPRVKGGPRGHRKHVKVLNMARGYRMSRHRLFKKANEAVTRAGEHAFAGRRQRRRDFRKLWIMRINGALTGHEMRYSQFINALKKAHIELDRKTLAEMAATDMNAFNGVVEQVKKAVKAK